MKKRTTLIILVALLIIALILGVADCARNRMEGPAGTTEVTGTTEPMENTSNTSEITETASISTEPEKETVPETTGPDQPQGGTSSSQQTGNSGNAQQTGGSGATGSGSGTSGNSGSGNGSAGTPAATEPPATKPTEHTHSYSVTSTVPATCTKEGSNTYTCSCGDSYTETIPMTAHNWVHHHEDEVKHEDCYIVCSCGARFYSTADWIAHTKNYDAVEAITNHGGYGEGSSWVVDSPAKDWDQCSICGATK